MAESGVCKLKTTVRRFSQRNADEKSKEGIATKNANDAKNQNGVIRTVGIFAYVSSFSSGVWGRKELFDRLKQSCDRVPFGEQMRPVDGVEDELMRIDTEGVVDGGGEVSDVNGVGLGMPADFVALAEV